MGFEINGFFSCCLTFEPKEHLILRWVGHDIINFLNECRQSLWSLTFYSSQTDTFIYIFFWSTSYSNYVMIESPEASVSVFCIICICIRLSYVCAHYVYIKLFEHDVITMFWNYFHSNCRPPLWKQKFIFMALYLINPEIYYWTCKKMARKAIIVNVKITQIKIT